MLTLTINADEKLKRVQRIHQDEMMGMIVAWRDLIHIYGQHETRIATDLGRDLTYIGMSLPYLWTESEEWHMSAAELGEMRATLTKIAAKHSFVLPEAKKEFVKVLIELASTIMCK